ncbi:MAG: mechanosensitive ion channel family protein [Opitutaceae bacterium]
MEETLKLLESNSILNNSIMDWSLAVVATFVLFLVLRLMFGVLQRRIGSLSKKTSTVADDIIAAALESTRTWSLFLAAVWGGGRFLDLGSANSYVDFALVIAITLQVALWANRMVTAYIIFYTDAKKADNPGAVSAVQGMSFIIRLVIWTIALLLLVDNLGYDVTALVAGLGISGIAVALALQNILGDLFASLSIVLDKPFVIGDFIIVGDLMGVVERIGLKTTRLKSLSGEQLVFSNSDLLSSRVRNFKKMQERRVPFGFGVIYQTTPEQLESIPPKIESIVAGLENTRFDRAHFKGFGDSSYDFEVVYYVLTADYAQYMDIQQAINLSLCRWFAEEGIEFAYPTRTLFINQD